MSVATNRLIIERFPSKEYRHPLLPLLLGRLKATATSVTEKLLNTLCRVADTESGAASLRIHKSIVHFKRPRASGREDFVDRSLPLSTCVPDGASYSVTYSISLYVTSVLLFRIVTR